MTRHLPSYRRARGEEGVALVWALAFLVVVGVVVFYVLGYVSTSTKATNLLAAQRSAVYSVDGAVNNAIRYVQNDATLSRGAIGGQPCNFTGTGTNGLNNLDVSVNCTPTLEQRRSARHQLGARLRDPHHGAVPRSGAYRAVA